MKNLKEYCKIWHSLEKEKEEVKLQKYTEQIIQKTKEKIIEELKRKLRPLCMSDKTHGDVCKIINKTIKGEKE